MGRFSPEWLANHSHGKWEGTGVPGSVSDFSIDTRTLKEGDLFVAIKTEQRDGHDFLEQAKQAGAVAALVTRVNPSIDLPQLMVSDTVAALQGLAKAHRESCTNPVVAITGSCGKTSTKEMLRLILGEQAYVTPKNLNNLLGVPLSILGWDYETHPIGVFEAGISEMEEMDQLAAIIQPTYGVITSIGESHLEGLQTVENVASEKNKLQEHVLEGGCRFYPEEILDYLDVHKYHFENIIIISRTEELSGSQHIHYSFRLLKLNNHMDALRVSISRSGVHVDYDLPEMSAGMVRNMVFAISLAESLGIVREKIQERVLAWQPFEKRGEEIIDGKSVIFFDSYNANPLSLVDSLSFFRKKYALQSKLYILGELAELGEHSAEIHYALGARLPVIKEDHVIFIGKSGAKAMKKGFDEKCQAFRSEIFTTDQLAEVKQLMNFHQGAIYIKGSRSLELERLLSNCG